MTTRIARIASHFVRFLFYWPCCHRDLHSFPTRRSSDLSFGAGFSDAAAPAKLTHGNRTEAGSARRARDRKSTRLNSSHLGISYAVFCLKKKTSAALSSRTGLRALPSSQSCRVAPG